jgi:hypothetical protein
MTYPTLHPVFDLEDELPSLIEREFEEVKLTMRMRMSIFGVI